MTDSTHLPPHDLNAEGAVLSAMMLEEWATARGLELLCEEHFYKAAHKYIFRAIHDLFNKNIEIDLITIIHEMKSKNVFEKSGGTAYLTEVQDVVSSSASIETHAQIVIEKAVLRRLITTASTILEECHSTDKGGKDIIEHAEKQIFDVSDGLDRHGFRSISQTLPGTLRRMDEVAKRKNMVIGVPSGIPELDRITGGFIENCLYVVAARPSMGKTALALNFAYNAAVRDGKSIGLISLETDKNMINLRMLSIGSRVSMFKLMTGYNFSKEDQLMISKTAEKIGDIQFYCDDNSNTTMTDVRSRARRLKYEHGVDMLIIDYMQLLIPTVRSTSTQREIAEISRSLKMLCKDLHIPVIAISQLSRGPETRQDKRPTLADLRDSGAIEQDADVVFLLYRDDYYNKDNSEKPGIAEIEIAKNKNGATGKIEMYFMKECMRFERLA